MNTILPSQLVDTIVKQFYVPRGAALECRVALQVMTLPDQLFQQLFVQLALELNASPSELTKTFFDCIVMKHLQTSKCPSNVTLKLEPKEPRFKQAAARAQSAASLDFQHRFAAALVDALSSCTGEARSFQDNAQLCKAVSQHFLQHGQAEFWKRVGKQISEKNCQQLRDYFQKSFLRCMYPECISGQDKLLLCRLIEQMEGQKPSAIADRFLEAVGAEKYFKRNIIMYVVNRKQK
ncbi:Hypothetical_protein [Hexamita inflata]|uniref:Hypothetical_protein n=1 Tax=Hexamita inflata TaxID=28002 RepID=A0AA86TBA1_9EUKA|nr:Hypothetical protein HINF_LOCUS1754 [Hexamita inflata]CAI9952240.1 Hypothetical protein HINF_LOCUS39885 [Hexamita inflata]